MLVKKALINSGSGINYREKKIIPAKYELGEGIAERILNHTGSGETRISYGFVC